MKNTFPPICQFALKMADFFEIRSFPFEFRPTASGPKFAVLFASGPEAQWFPDEAGNIWW